ncbi:MAG: GGDEF domain-containing protein [Solirubrobacteraceae bacterium]
MRSYFNSASPLARDLRSSSRDFYARADLPLAKRLGGLLWIVGALVVTVLLPLSPPTATIGDWGWAVTSCLFAATFAAAWRLLARPGETTPNELMASSYATLAVIGLLVWLGGEHAPYAEVFLLSVLFTAAFHPPRRVLPYLVVLAAITAAPLAYGDWNATLVAEVAGRLIIWWGIAVVTMAYASRVRAQRLGLEAEGQEARMLARVDSLTGLGNRRAFDEAVEKAVARARRYGRPLTVIVADLDSFKEINDSFGHIAGDECLRCVAEVVDRTVRRPDSCFRWGGDEFAILAETDAAGAWPLCARVTNAVSERCSAPDGRPLSVRLGAAELRDGISVDELVTEADLELIVAKST